MAGHWTDRGKSQQHVHVSLRSKALRSTVQANKISFSNLFFWILHIAISVKEPKPCAAHRCCSALGRLYGIAYALERLVMWRRRFLADPTRAATTCGAVSRENPLPTYIHDWKRQHLALHMPLAECPGVCGSQSRRSSEHLSHASRGRGSPSCVAIPCRCGILCRLITTRDWQAIRGFATSWCWSRLPVIN